MEIGLADDSHEMSRLISMENKKICIVLKPCVLQL